MLTRAQLWTAAVAGTAAIALPAIGAGAAGAPLVADQSGVGALRLGRTLAAIRTAHVLGPVTPGCELASPRPSAARLRHPLRGFATFVPRNGNRRLVALSITEGAVTKRKIGIGSTAASVRKAYPSAKVNDSPAPNPLQFSALVVSRAGHDRIWFMLDHKGGRVVSIEIPSPQFCD